MTPPRLNGTDISDAHRYLAKAKPDWNGSMAAIRNRGGPWRCSVCSGASLLIYRCSKCGADRNRD